MAYTLSILLKIKGLAISDQTQAQSSPWSCWRQHLLMWPQSIDRTIFHSGLKMRNNKGIWAIQRLLNTENDNNSSLTSALILHFWRMRCQFLIKTAILVQRKEKLLIRDSSVFLFPEPKKPIIFYSRVKWIHYTLRKTKFRINYTLILMTSVLAGQKGWKKSQRLMLVPAYTYATNQYHGLHYTIMWTSKSIGQRLEVAITDQAVQNRHVNDF